MKSSWRSFIRVVVCCIFAASLSSCVDTLPYRSTINPSRSIAEPEPCAEGQRQVDSEDGEFFTCEDILVRPNNAVRFKDDFCLCRDGKALNFGSCAAFCTGRSPGQETFYANFTVGPEISLGFLGSVHGWCTRLLPDETTANPQCKLEFRDDSNNTVTLDAIPGNKSNSISLNVSNQLAEDKTYVVTLFEETSGARSNSIQFVKYSEDVSFPTLGPLKNAPVSQYTCIIRTSVDNGFGDPDYIHAYRLHFYFLPRLPPLPIPGGTSFLFCHDIYTHGPNDSDGLPRLEHIPGIFNLWDLTDPRFFDTNGNSITDVTELIIQKNRRFGGGSLPTNISFFSPFPWPGSPVVNEEAGNNNAPPNLGYFMKPWIDRTNFRSYCLNNSHYNSTNSLFRAMRDVIGVETEGLYIGVNFGGAINHPDGSTTQAADDFILIRETDLKRVWYVEDQNMVPKIPNETTVADLQPYFNYPLNFENPFVLSSSQRKYRLRGGSEVSTGNPSGDGSTSNIQPHDRKIGCIPKF